MCVIKFAWKLAWSHHHPRHPIAGGWGWGWGWYFDNNLFQSLNILGINPSSVDTVLSYMEFENETYLIFSTWTWTQHIQVNKSQLKKCWHKFLIVLCLILWNNEHLTPTYQKLRRRQYVLHFKIIIIVKGISWHMGFLSCVCTENGQGKWCRARYTTQESYPPGNHRAGHFYKYPISRS